MVLSALVLGAMVPAHAGYDKFYRFKNTTGASQSAVRAIMLGTEIIGAQYGYDATYNPWGEGTQGLQNYGGLYCSTLKWPGDNPADVANGTVLKLGWNSTDHSLQLADFRWLNSDGTAGSTISPNTDNSNVPGGGVLTYNSSTNCYEWTIINNTDSVILLAQWPPTPGDPNPPTTVEVGSFTVPLEMGDLERIADEGICGGMIRALEIWVQIEEYVGTIPSPSATSLLKKLYKAEDELRQAIQALEMGDMVAFDYHRDAAVKAMTTFVSELLRSKIPEGIRNELAAAGNEVIARLNALPEGLVPPDYYGIIPPVLYPAGSTEGPWFFTLSIPAGDLEVGDSLVMHGTVHGNQGALDWVDRALIKADLQSPTLTVSPAKADVGSLDDVPGAWYDGKTNWTVTLSADDVGSGVAGLIVIEDGTPLTPGSVTLPKEWTLASEDLTLFCVPGSSWTQTYSSGAHTIAAVAVDYAGNLSKEKIIKVGVDTGPPVIAWYGGLTDPDRLWSPDHTLRLVHLLYQVSDDNPEWCNVTLEAISSEPDNGTGDGDYPDDIWFAYEGGREPGGVYFPNFCTSDPYAIDNDLSHYIWLRSERSGPLVGRSYFVRVIATDAAGNSTSSQEMEIFVSHDQGSKLLP
jgi:hypothetical protein